MDPSTTSTTTSSDKIFNKDFSIYQSVDTSYSCIQLKDFNDFVEQKQAILDIIYDNLYRTRYRYFLEVYFESPESLTYSQLSNILANMYNFSLENLKESYFLDFNIIFPQITKSKSVLERHPKDISVVLLNPKLSSASKYIEGLSKEIPRQEVKELVKSGIDATNYFIQISDQPSETKIKSYKRVCMGGTYDYLHSGHKVLLSCALLIAVDHITIGITANAMLAKKKNSSVIQCFQTRRGAADRFMTYFDPSVELNLVQIEDPAGPARDQPFDAIIVTPETLSGGQYVNNLRKDLGHNQLEVVVADLVQDPNIGKKAGEQVKNDEKISSSVIRGQIVTRLGNDADKMVYLKQQWDDLFEALKIEDQALRNTYFDKVRVYYMETWRYYHTLNHVYSLLKLIDEEKSNVQDINLMRLIAWFHDIIYIPNRSDNEEQSARVFEEFSSEAKLDSELIAKVKKVIIQTANHMEKNEEIDNWEDAKFFLDIDLAILGAPKDEYMEYAKNVRKEYCHIEESKFREARAKFMNKFVSGDLQPYRTELFKNKFYSSCIENVKSEIAVLTGK